MSKISWDNLVRAVTVAKRKGIRAEWFGQILCMFVCRYNQIERGKYCVFPTEPASWQT
jgi:hypothetical protein